MAIQPGDRLGHYRIERRLRDDGATTFYQAYDTELARVVSIQVVRPVPGTDPDALAHFMAAARVWAGLDLPNVLSILDLGVQDGLPYVVTDSMAGDTLERLGEGSLSSRDAAILLLPIGRAIEAAHRHGVTHGAVKAGNILLAPDGQPLLAGFDRVARSRLEARATPRTPLPNGPIGALGHTQQHQPLDLVTDPHVDIQSLEDLFCDLVSGAPVDERQRSESAAPVQGDQRLTIPPPPALSSDLRKRVWPTVLARPEGGFTTMQSLVTTLERLAGAQSPAALAFDWMHPLVRWLIALTMVASALAVTLALVRDANDAVPVPRLVTDTISSRASTQVATTDSMEEILLEPTAEPLTHGTGDDYSASVSPDGREIAFVSDRSGNFELYVMDWDGTDVRRLTTTPDLKEGMPFYSPDGAWIIYGGVSPLNTEDLLVYNRQTAEITYLTQTADISEGHARFSMTGTEVVYTSDQHDGNFDIFRARFDQGNLVDAMPLVTLPASVDRVPSYSPIGDRIIFRSESTDMGVSTSQISSYWIRDQRVTHLTNQSAYWYPSFSPDGRWIVVHSERDRLPDGSPNREIYLLDATSGDVIRRLTNDLSDDILPAFSPDGAWVLFSSNRAGSNDLYRVPVAPGKP